MRLCIFYILSYLLLAVNGVVVPQTSQDEDIFSGLSFNETSTLEGLEDILHARDIEALRRRYSTPEGSDELEKRAITINALIYRVTIDGRNQGNWQNWIVSGNIVVTSPISTTTKNGRNLLDFFISVGSPAASPVAGSIRYFTNRYLYTLANGRFGQSRLDYVYQTRSGSTYTNTIDTRYAAANQLSGFNARSGLLANVYLPDVGSWTFTVGSGSKTCRGQIRVDGRGFIEPGRAPYRGKYSGTLISTRKLTF
ncbi:hypothetical protein TWF569_009242 [Orbilia oligospora]|uniref:Uncharacterized protein n=1 Tax=Orbilia oligospora TaxID=2813651 RepID=A0A7C8JUU2_ORBOL|nr:hypothetical protein TWF706_006623 [Orbilia oligospora]KAF3104816.1 hypothetical protein TWF103_006790 [Orbilia oligospora]KAF3109251.1 hypothetical protein TWF102_010024 [Orbilia oligospora]KAF3135097.1 hypothetical protein TWF594_008487 [Orbilia oligospora]KAF3137308.1 hypothetical protein TWF569_009242 [Orbilia oligospora]